MSGIVKLPDLSTWTKAPAGHVVHTGGPYAVLDEEGDIAYVSASKIDFTVTPVEAVYLPPRQLPTAPGSVICATLTGRRGTRPLLRCSDEEAYDGFSCWWDAFANSYEPGDFDSWELIHDEGARR